MRRLIATTTLVLGAWSVALAQQPCVMPREDLVNPVIRAVVRQTSSDLHYEYSVTNGASAQQRLVSFGIEAFTVPLPVQMSPPGWSARGPIRGTSWMVWSTFVEPLPGLHPGTSISGFGFVSPAPPTIVTFLAWGDVELPSVPEGEAPDDCENSDIIQNSFKGTTIGPRTPPAPFVALEAVNHLIALLRESRRQGWILRDGVHQSMHTKLTGIKRRLEVNDFAGAKNTLNAFLAEVAGASCEDFDCPGNQPSTSEAYALLYFNGKYLLDRLP